MHWVPDKSAACLTCLTIDEAEKWGDALVVTVVLGMLDACPARGHLHIPSLHRLDIAHAVLVAKLARDNVREDLGFSVRMSWEPLVWLQEMSAVIPIGDRDLRDREVKDRLTATRSSLITRKAPKLSKSSFCHDAKEKVWNV